MIILCYFMLFYVILCYSMLFYVILCYSMLFYVILCYSMLFYVILCYFMLFYVILCYSMSFYVTRNDHHQQSLKWWISNNHFNHWWKRTLPSTLGKSRVFGGHHPNISHHSLAIPLHLCRPNIIHLWMISRKPWVSRAIGCPSTSPCHVLAKVHFDPQWAPNHSQA